jgi:hypothetical protein
VDKLVDVLGGDSRPEHLAHTQESLGSHLADDPHGLDFFERLDADTTHGRLRSAIITLGNVALARRYVGVSGGAMCPCGPVFLFPSILVEARRIPQNDLAGHLQAHLFL